MPPPTTTQHNNLQRVKGMKIGLIPEVKNDKDAPPILEQRDIFREWF